MLFDDDFGFDDALMLGTGYALYRHGQDEQTAELVRALNSSDAYSEPVEVNVHIHADEDRQAAPVTVVDFATVDMPEDWDSYIGQEPLKKQLMVAIKSAEVRKAPLPHTLLASGSPGIGKTTMARLMAKSMGRKIVELVPPFNIYTLAEAAQQLGNGDILFIDEIHKLADTGARGAEILLKVLEDHTAYLPDGRVVPLNQITVVGATTDRDKLPETIIDRFKIKPYFQPYSLVELGRITVVFAYKHRAEEFLTNEMAFAIASACRGTPRIIEEMVLGMRDLGLTYGKQPTPEELLAYLEVEADGLTRTHAHYLTAMRQYFGRENSEGRMEYVAGEASMMQLLRETKQGIGRIERFLIERGFLDRTPRGRRLTALGISRAESLIRHGKGSADVA